MIHQDQGFPIIEYSKDLSSYENGFNHGKSYKQGIKELSTTRRELMLKKSPHLKSRLDQLAMEQFEQTKILSQDLASELEGIANGSEVSLTDIIILNNYTDFRDINLPDEGCSTIYTKLEDNAIAGQTWDMHSSAKNYVCVLKIPTPGTSHQYTYLFSLVGCLGMMGVSQRGMFIGVNNVNTTDAQVGVAWPSLIRKALEAKSLEEMERAVTQAKVTSGHNYLLATSKHGAHYEVSPKVKEKLSPQGRNFSFHTNHCLGKKMIEVEDSNAISSTTHSRYEVLLKETGKINSAKAMITLLKSHEQYPKSICSHFESGAQDPSMTCGGAVYDFNNKVFHIWRGCQEYDKNYVEYNILL